MDDVRAWVDRPWTVGVAARGDRVLITRKVAVDGGERWRHQVEEHTPEQDHRLLTPSHMSCLEPVLLGDGSLVVRTDDGVPGGPMRVAERSPSGVWKRWTEGSASVVAMAAAADTVVVLERSVVSDAPWQAEVAVCTAGPARFWQSWGVEAVHRLVVIDRRTGRRRVIVEAAGRLLTQCALALSPEGRWLAWTPVRVADDGILQKGLGLMPLADPGRRRTLWGPPNSDHSAPVFSPDGTQLAVVRHRRPPTGHGRKQLMVVQVDTGEQREACRDWSHWLVPQGWSDAQGLVCLATVAERVGAYRVRPDAARPTPIDTGTWSWEALAVGAEVWGLGSRLDAPPKVRRVDAVGPPTVTMPWSVGAACPNLFWPAAFVEARPLVLMVHGGPVSAWSDAWHPRQAAAFFHALGCHVLLPNPVGSIGHGEAHVDGIWHDWDRCIDSLVALLHEAAARTDVSQVVLFGGSFGGWAVNRLATRTDIPHLAGVITHASIFDHHAMRGSCDEPALFSWHLGASAEALERANPARAVGHWRTPTLILHGAQDFCVPVDQAVALHHALDAGDVPHRLVVFPDEGHHIVQPKAQVRWWWEIRDFLFTVCGLGAPQSEGGQSTVQGNGSTPSTTSTKSPSSA